MSKTFEDFKQQVAEKYNAFNWPTLMQFCNMNISLHNKDIYLQEAAELYAQYQREEGRKEGYQNGYDDSIYQLRSNNDNLTFNKGWNEALDMASKVIDQWPNRILTISEEQEEILNLKK